MECKVKRQTIHVTWRRVDPEYKRCPGQKVTGPVAVHSVMLVSASGNVVARGLAFCSAMDSPNDARGFNIAFGRARKALELAETSIRPEDCRPVRRREVIDLLRACDIAVNGDISQFAYKVLYKPLEDWLSPKEQRALATWRHRNVPEKQAAVG